MIKKLPTKKEQAEIKNRVISALGKVEIKECEICGKYISKKEFDSGEGACYRCWDNPSSLK